MEFYIDPDFLERALGYARTIAQIRGHVVNEHGLPVATVLASKRLAEIEELREAIVEGKERVWLLSEIDDVAYYSICLDRSAPLSTHPYAWYVECLQMAHTYCIDQEEVEATLEAKYSLRSTRPYRKDKETLEEKIEREREENEAIQSAIDALSWPGYAVSDISKQYDIPPSSIYSAMKSDLITFRQSGGTRLIRLDQKTKTWIRRQQFLQFRARQKQE